MGPRQLERMEDEIEAAIERGEISPEEAAREMRELHRDYRDAAEESARDAYERELERW